jgi:hypothetical protein
LPVLALSYVLKNSRYKAKVIKFLLVLLLVFTPILLLNQSNSLAGHKQDDWLVGNFNSIHNLADRGLKNFLILDLNSYLMYPNIDPVLDERGRQYFWVYLIKTSLYHEQPIINPIQIDVASILNVLTLVLIFSLIIRIVKFKKSEFYLYSPLLMYLGFFVISIMIFRYFYPCPCSNNFRYIYPAIIPIIIFMVKAEELFKKDSIAGYSYIMLLGVFISLATLFSFSY